MKLSLAVLVLLAVSSAIAQQAPLSEESPGVTVRYNFEWAQGYPWQKYDIDVQSDGKTRFEGTPQADGNYDTDPYQQSFVLTDADRQKVFDLAKKLNYFQGDYDSHLKNIARTGTKTLQYDSPQVKGSTSFNYSKNLDVQELERFFTGIALTIDYGRKLAFQYRFDKLGMEQRLKELEHLQANGDVAELEVISPILHKTADDPNMMNIARQSAQRLLRKMGQNGTATPTSASQ